MRCGPAIPGSSLSLEIERRMAEQNIEMTDKMRQKWAKICDLKEMLRKDLTSGTSSRQAKYSNTTGMNGNKGKSGRW